MPTSGYGYLACSTCKARIRTVRDAYRRKMPPLNWAPDNTGTVAVSFVTPVVGRFLAHGEEPGRLEHRHSVHQCEATAEPLDGGR